LGFVVVVDCGEEEAEVDLLGTEVGGGRIFYFGAEWLVGVKRTQDIVKWGLWWRCQCWRAKASTVRRRVGCRIGH
jgi:hypothetical protein